MTILLVCASGASSSCLARNMNVEAKKIGREDIHVMAKSEYEVEGYIDSADALLIGPHLRNLEAELQDLAAEYNIRAKCISSEAYGTLNGQLALQEALELVNG